MPKYTSQETKPTCPQDCVIYNKCNAPICPTEKVGIWFADEDICTNEHFQNDKLVKNQKKLKKANAEGGFDTTDILAIKRVRNPVGKY